MLKFLSKLQLRMVVDILQDVSHDDLYARKYGYLKIRDLLFYFQCKLHDINVTEDNIIKFDDVDDDELPF